MKKFLEKLLNAGRKKHNADLLSRMRDGENLQSYSAQASWYPPRPILKKDSAAIAELYGKKEGGSAESPKDTDKSS